MTAERVSVLVKFPPELLGRVEARGSEHGISRMAAIVALIERGLDGPAGALAVVPVGGGRKIPVEGAAGVAVSNFTPNGEVSGSAAMAAVGIQFGPAPRGPRPKGGALKKSSLAGRFSGGGK